jgi:hypothetical protein
VNLNSQPTNEVPTELEAYLSKQAIPRSDDFDILGSWKNNSMEYPTLSRMARDVLVAPASSFHPNLLSALREDSSHTFEAA